jgi:hypothetical protein
VERRGDGAGPSLTACGATRVDRRGDSETVSRRVRRAHRTPRWPRLEGAHGAPYKVRFDGPRTSAGRHQGSPHGPARAG